MESMPTCHSIVADAIVDCVMEIMDITVSFIFPIGMQKLVLGI